VLFVVAFIVYIMMCIEAMDDLVWTWKFLFVSAVWSILAICIYVWPTAKFCSGLVSGMPITAAFYVHVGVVHFAVWDVVQLPVLTAVLAFLPLAGVVGCHLVTDTLNRAGQSAHRIVLGLETSGKLLRRPGAWLQARWMALRFTMAKRPKLFWGVEAGLALWSAMIVLVMSSGCLALYNTRLPAGTHSMELFSFSTWLSRQALDPACPEAGGAPCHVYLSVSYNISSQMFVSAHTHPGVADLVVHFDGTDATGGVPANVNMTRYPVAGLEELGKREVHSAHLTGLSPGATYNVSIAYGDGGTSHTRLYKFRTGPGGGQPYNFTSGGDVGNTHEASYITSAAAAMEPLFAMVGGDVAYENAMRSCYRCWDLWLADWEERMVTPQGYTVPMVVNIGNHDAGTNTLDNAFASLYPFSGDDAKMPLFNYFFPQVDHLVNETKMLAPWDRPPYHAHVVGNSTVYTSLDSGYVVPYGGKQAAWMDQIYTNFSDFPVKIALYHVPIFPMDVNIVGAGDPNARAVPDGLEHWVPLFDKHNVSLAFENHVHTYKRSYPLVNGACQPVAATGKCNETARGTVYLGDGYWGITQGMGFPSQDKLLIDPHQLIAKAGVRYHTWFIEVRGTEALTVQAIAGVPCPELDGEVCRGAFDTANVTLAPVTRSEL
jgi:hypothetical protein